MRISGGDDEQLPDGNDNGDNHCDDAEAEESDLEHSGNNNTEESELDLLLDSVRDPIDRLYKVSTKIRNPSSRLGSSKAANHPQIDEETGVDFLRAVEQADYDHIRSLFLQYQKARALQERDTVEPTNDATEGEDDGDGVWSRSGPFCPSIELSIPFLFAASPAQTYGEGSSSRTEKCTEKNWLAMRGLLYLHKAQLLQGPNFPPNPHLTGMYPTIHSYRRLN